MYDAVCHSLCMVFMHFSDNVSLMMHTKCTHYILYTYTQCHVSIINNAFLQFSSSLGILRFSCSVSSYIVWFLIDSYTFYNSKTSVHNIHFSFVISKFFFILPVFLTYIYLKAEKINTERHILTRACCQEWRNRWIWSWLFPVGLGCSVRRCNKYRWYWQGSFWGTLGN